MLVKVKFEQGAVSKTYTRIRHIVFILSFSDKQQFPVAYQEKHMV